MIKFLPETVRFVGQDRSVRQQIEDSAVSARHWRIKLPAGKNGDSAGAHRLLHNFFRASDALAGKPGMNRTQQFVADRSLSQRKQQRFVDRSGRSLRCRIELADRFDFIAKELDAQRDGPPRANTHRGCRRAVRIRRAFPPHQSRRNQPYSDGAAEVRYQASRPGEPCAPDRHNIRLTADARAVAAIGRYQNRNRACRDFP